MKQNTVPVSATRANPNQTWHALIFMRTPNVQFLVCFLGCCQFPILTHSVPVATVNRGKPMAFDPTQPATGSPQKSAPVRGNFKVLDALMDATLTTEQMQMTTNGLGVLHAL